MEAQAVQAGPGRRPKFGQKLVTIHPRVLPIVAQAIKDEAYETREFESHIVHRRLAESYGIALHEEAEEHSSVECETDHD